MSCLFLLREVFAVRVCVGFFFFFFFFSLSKLVLSRFDLTQHTFFSNVCLFSFLSQQEIRELLKSGRRRLDNSSKSGLGVELLEGGVHDGGDHVDDTVVAGDVARVGRSSAEVVGLADDGVIEEGLAELALVGDGLSVDGGDVGSDGGGGVLSDEDVVLDDALEVGVGLEGVDLSIEAGVDGGDDGDVGGGEIDTGGVGELGEHVHVVVSLDLVLVMGGVVGGSIGSPAEVGSLGGLKGLADGGVHGRIGAGGERNRGEGRGRGDEGGEKGELHGIKFVCLLK
mmetsp:Transcript_21357/g.40124  ORF Transcript_21357/g.40124 Transcript_21357/m.40124 type:complete len:283 (+) Transcript_21357:61-909(+)